MGHKRIVGGLLGGSILLLIVSLSLMFPCDPRRNFVCEGKLTEQVGQPMFFGSIALGLIFILFYFLPQQFFKAWLKYVAWFIPVAIIWIVTADVSCGGYLPICFDKELATWWSSGIYLALSLIVIGLTFAFGKSGEEASN
jgi:hypothetical protein